MNPENDDLDNYNQLRDVENDTNMIEREKSENSQKNNPNSYKNEAGLKKRQTPPNPPQKYQKLPRNPKKTRKYSVEITEKKRSFLQKYKKGLVHRKLTKNKDEILSGITVALAQIPEAIAFALTATVNPLVGLNAAFILGFITAVFGGRPGMISGATGALAVVQGPVVLEKGEEVLFAIMIACGVIQIVIGLVGGGKLIRLVPEPVMIGFLNGLAIVIGLAQINSFRGVDCLVGDQRDPSQCEFISGKMLWFMILMTVGTFAFILLFALIPKIGNIIPSSLLALIICTVINKYGRANTKTIRDITKISGQFPYPHLPNIKDIDFSLILYICRKGLEFSLIGLIESLMTLQLIDQFTKTKGSLKMEAIAQGIGNFLCGWSSSLGGCAMIGQSQINVHSGGIKRLSSIVASLGVLLIILVASPIIEIIPIASLTGLMFVVVFKTFYWPSFLMACKMRGWDFFIVIVVTAVTIIMDLAVAVIVGIIISSILYVWDRGFEMECFTESEDGTKSYFFKGDLFFSSVKGFLERFRYNFDTDDRIILDLENVRVMDFSGVEAIYKVYKSYVDIGKKFYICNLNWKSFQMIKKSKLIKKEFFSLKAE